MRKYLVFLFVSLFLYCSAFAQTESPPPAEGTFSTYFSPKQSVKLTITSENGIVSVLEVREGVILNVVASEERNPGFNEPMELPRTYRGDITIRLRRQDEVQETESRVAQEIMARAPLEMTLKNAVVLLETVEPKTEHGER